MDSVLHFEAVVATDFGASDEENVPGLGRIKEVHAGPEDESPGCGKVVAVQTLAKGSVAGRSCSSNYNYPACRGSSDFCHCDDTIFRGLCHI